MKYFFLIIMFLFLAKHSGAQLGTAITQEQLDSLPYVIVDTLPHYPGGQDAVNTYIYKGLNYPIREMNHIYGTAYLFFIVEKNGSLSNVEVKKGISSNVDDDLLRVVKSMKGWKPGIKDGKPVRTSTFLAFKFKPR